MPYLNDLRKALREFNTARNWEQFHSPKNLAAGLAIEAAELQEIFLWQTEEDSFRPDAERLEHLKEEIGDVLLYLVNLADKFDLDPIQCAFDKMKKNGEKYPVEKAKGNALKYHKHWNKDKG